MNHLLDKARQKLAELEAEAEKMRTFIRVYEDLAGHNSVDEHSKVASEPGPTGFPVTFAPPAVVVESCKAAISKEGRPMTRSELVRALYQNGVSLAGTDKRKNLGTILWRSKQFDNVEGVGYWPKDLGTWVGQRLSPEQRELLG
ncbi:MAG TPA: hypothetical protein VF702_08800 [Allosphingosinicella sp.]|jgi:hypothetical protein